MTSATALTAINSPHSGEVLCALLRVTDPTGLSGSLPILVASDNADTFVVGSQTVRGITFGGENYLWFPFEITLPTIADDTSPVAQLEISGVDRRVTRAVRTMSTAPQVDIIVIVTSQRAVSGYTPERRLDGFRWRDIDYGTTTVSGALTYENLLNEPYPYRTMNPTDFPGMHQK